MNAASEGHEFAVKALLAAGADAGQLDKWVRKSAWAGHGGWLVVTVGAYYGHELAMKALLEGVADVGKVNSWVRKIVVRMGGGVMAVTNLHL
jgi:hypothetical protein